MECDFKSSNVEFKQLSAIKGLRLQPLINIKTGNAIAYEVLSWMKIQDIETWFINLAPELHLAIFNWQVSEVLKRTGTFWLNLPVKVLCSPKLVNSLLLLSHQNRIVIEVQDSGNISILNGLEKLHFIAGVNLLRRAGWSVWLDDVTSEIARELPGFNVAVDGIKIDRKELLNRESLGRLINDLSFINEKLLIEGIENKEQLDYVSRLNINYAQGFLWKEEKIPLTIPHDFESLAKYWFDNRLKNEINQTKIYIRTNDNYVAQGICYLLWEISSTDYQLGKLSSITICNKAEHADLIVNEYQPGDVYFKCELTSLGCFSLLKKIRTYIYVYKSSKYRLQIRCPGNIYSLCFDDKLSAYRNIIKESLSDKPLIYNKTDYKNYFSACRLCHNRKLTKREKEIADMMANGLSSQKIANHFGCTRKVVGAHKRALMRKLNILSNFDYCVFLNKIANRNKPL